MGEIGGGRAKGGRVEFRRVSSEKTSPTKVVVSELRLPIRASIPTFQLSLNPSFPLGESKYNFENSSEPSSSFPSSSEQINPTANA